MKVEVTSVDEKHWGLKHNNGWILNPYDDSPLLSEKKSNIEFLAKNINKKEISERGIALDEPYATLYYSLYWINKINAGKDPISDDPEWEISCDPVFHLQPGPPLLQLQIAAFTPVINWLEKNGVKHIDLPLFFTNSKEEWEDLKKDPAHLIGGDNSHSILKEWNKLSTNEKAVSYFLQYNISAFRHSLCASLLFLTKEITNSQFTEICCAAEGISPMMGDVSEKDYDKMLLNFKYLADQANVVLKILND